jgi:succinylglutamate desuccinylase
MFSVLDGIPDNLLELPHDRLYRELDGPTLFHLEGKRNRPLFVSVLLHGNEPTGLLAVQLLIKKYRERALPRSLSVLIGNVEAARYNRRFLDGQPDFNRIWQAGGHPANLMAGQVVAEMRRRDVFASVDIHNTSGVNPHHALTPRVEDRFFHLATLFSRTVIFYSKPEGTKSAAFAGICPSVTIECGRPGHSYSVEHACEFLEACLHLDHFPADPVRERDIELFHVVAIVKLPKNVSFGFGECGEDICFRDDLDRLNFRKLPAGTVIASVKPACAECLEVTDQGGNDVTAEYFARLDGEILLARETIPTLLTLREEAIRQDCLCYFMENYDYSKPPAAGKETD